MGQYYMPVFLDEDKKEVQEHAYSHSCGNGLKLMEHSYLRNNFVNAVVNRIKTLGGAYLCWAGDYADGEKKKINKANGKDIWRNLVAAGETEVGFETFWRSDDPRLYINDPESKNLYSQSEGTDEIPYDLSDPDIRYIVNEDKKQYVDLWRLPTVAGWTIHPLPLLTSEGNGRGGGDYYGLGMKYVGTWARDYIVVLTGLQYAEIDKYVQDGYQEIKPNFAETYGITSDLNNLKSLLQQAVNEGVSENDNFYQDVRERTKELLSILPREK